jgi:hypothetical protein
MDGWMDGRLEGWMKNETKVHEKPKEGRIRAKEQEQKERKQNSIFIKDRKSVV